MKLQSNQEHFSKNPTNIDISRSIFRRPFQHKGSANLGEIIPFYCEEVLPGDGVKTPGATIIRTGTLIAPLMDNLYFDMYYFFVPYRLIWNHWKQFMGENDSTAWTQRNEYEVPTQRIMSNNNQYSTGTTLFNYLTGVTQKKDASAFDEPINELPLRAYYAIYNEWFRNENLKAPVLFDLGDDENQHISYADKPMKASKFKDYFYSALPAPQKGTSVSLPLGLKAPLGSSEDSDESLLTNGLMFNTQGQATTTGKLYLSGAQEEGIETNKVYQSLQNETGVIEPDGKITMTNLYADLSKASAATVNQLRAAFALQKKYEKDARGGTRYQEVIKAHFGVESPDARMQIPEYLSGKRIRVNIDQVLATSQTNENGEIINPQGNTAGWSCTADVQTGATKAFTEHGLIMGVCVMRQDNTYSESMKKLFLKKTNLDFYLPVFANIGEQPVLFKEKHFNNSANHEDEIYGYQEAWAEYRYSPSISSGLLNVNADNSLNYWTLTEGTSEQTLQQEFEATGENLDRALAATSEATGAQYIFDILVNATWSRAMPTYSIPGLIDHH